MFTPSIIDGRLTWPDLPENADGFPAAAMAEVRAAMESAPLDAWAEVLAWAESVEAWAPESGAVVVVGELADDLALLAEVGRRIMPIIEQAEDLAENMAGVPTAAMLPMLMQSLSARVG